MEAELRERSFLPEDPQNCAPHTNKPLETEMCISARCALTQEETIQLPVAFRPSVSQNTRL